MFRYPFILFLIYINTIADIYSQISNLILLKPDHHSTYCVAGSNTDSGIYIAGNIGKTEEYGNYMNEIKLKGNDYIRLNNVTENILKPVLDKRWQTFPSQFTYKNSTDDLTDNYIILSIRCENEVYIKLNDYWRIAIFNNGTVEQQRLKSTIKFWESNVTEYTNAAFSSYKWIHVGVDKRRQKFFIFDTENTINITLNYPIGDIKCSSRSLAEWKVHKFNFWEINDVLSDTSFDEAIFINENISYIGAYVLLCDNCEFKMGLGTHYLNIFLSTSIKGDGLNWKQIKITIPPATKQGTYLLILRTKSDNANRHHNFWFMSHFHYGYKNEYRVSKLDGINDDYQCATLNGLRIIYSNNTAKQYHCAKDFLGKDCQINCNNIAKEACNSSMICTGTMRHNTDTNECFYRYNPKNKLSESETTSVPEILSTTEEIIKKNIGANNSTSNQSGIYAWEEVFFWSIIIIIIVASIGTTIFYIFKCVNNNIKKKIPPLDDAYEKLKLTSSLLKSDIDIFEKYVQDLIITNCPIVLEKNDYISVVKPTYEDPIFEKIRFDRIDYIYSTTYRTESTFWYTVWNRNISFIIFMYNDIEKTINVEPNKIGIINKGQLKLDFKKIEKTSNFTVKSIDIYNTRRQRREIKIYELYWCDDGYPTNLIKLLFHLLKDGKEPRAILSYCGDKNRNILFIMCHACLKYVKENERFLVDDILKLLEASNRLFDNSLLLNYMLRRLFLVLLECLTMKNTTIELEKNFFVNVANKINGGLLNKEMAYLRSINWRDKAMADLAQLDTQNLREIYGDGRKYIMVPTPTSATILKYLKHILNNNVDILVSFNYSLADLASKHVTIVTKKQKENEFYVVNSCVIHFSPNLFKSNTNIYTKSINVITMKASFNDATKFVKFCNVVGNYLNKNVKVIYVTCKNGISMCGTYVAYMLVKEQVKFDDSCDVFSVIRQMYHLDNRFFRKEKDYKFLYDLIGEYIREKEGYTYITTS